MLYQVLTHPDPLLRRKHKPVERFDAELAQFCENMIETMKVYQGVGLAAAQIGDQRSVFVMDMTGVDTLEDEFRRLWVIINPKITVLDKTPMPSEEGCLSIPGIFSTVSRAQKIRLDYQDIKGALHTQARLVMTDCKRLCMQRDLPLTLAFESRALEITADVMKQMVHLTAGCGADFFQVGHPNQSLDNTGTLKLIGDALSALRLEGAGHCGIKAMLESSTLEEVHQAQKVISNHGGRGWFAHKDIARLILPDLLQES